MNQHPRRPAWPFIAAGSALILAALAAGGTWALVVYGMSDPVPPSLGARIEGQTIVVKIPVCPSHMIRRVDVTDLADDTTTEPKVLWWASAPAPTPKRNGVVKLWSGEGFERHASPPASVPRDLVVRWYLRPSSNGRDGVITPAEVAAAQLKPGQYWTPEGARTSAQIDAQLSCNN